MISLQLSELVPSVMFKIKTSNKMTLVSNILQATDIANDFNSRTFYTLVILNEIFSMSKQSFYFISKVIRKLRHQWYGYNLSTSDVEVSTLTSDTPSYSA